MSGFATRAVHGPAEPDPGSALPHSIPIQQTTSFTFPTVRDGIAAFQGSGDYLYTRKANPTVRALERHVSALEAVPVASPEGPRAPAGDVDSLFFASGMAAISATALGIAASSRIVAQGGIYGTTEAMVTDLGRFGIEVDLVPVGDLAALASAVGRGQSPALVYVESPANPLLQVTDIAAAADIAHGAGALLAVDATFATPALQRPLAWAADLVLHSTTKFMAGHGVALGGVVSGASTLLADRIEPMRNRFGGCADPFAAWLTLLGLKTLEVRISRHVENAEAIAAFLRGHAAVTRVHRPDLDRLPPGQMTSGGPMLSFEVDGGESRALELIDRLRLITLAPTLGNVESLIQHPWSMSHVVLSERRRREMGIAPGLLRVSVGLEAADDLIADLEQALAP